MTKDRAATPARQDSNANVAPIAIAEIISSPDTKRPDMSRNDLPL
jgi:hypothetical protein